MCSDFGKGLLCGFIRDGQEKVCLVFGLFCKFVVVLFEFNVDGFDIEYYVGIMVVLYLVLVGWVDCYVVVVVFCFDQCIGVKQIGYVLSCFVKLWIFDGWMFSSLLVFCSSR